MDNRKIKFLDLEFSNIGIDTAVLLIDVRSAGMPFRYVVTPNADHLVRLARSPASAKQIYSDAWMCLLDSRVVARLARLFGFQTPPVVPGSDLTATLIRQVIERFEIVTILGMRDEQALVLEQKARLKFNRYNPPIGFEHNPAEFMRAVEFIEKNPSRLILLAVGSPRQEMVAQMLKLRGRATGIGLCIGASLDFLAGGERRAPGWVQRAGFEWAWRLAQNPKRMWRRYLVDCPRVLGLLWREREASRASSPSRLR